MIAGVIFAFDVLYPLVRQTLLGVTALTKEPGKGHRDQLNQVG